MYTTLLLCHLVSLYIRLSCTDCFVVICRANANYLSDLFHLLLLLASFLQCIYLRWIIAVCLFYQPCKHCWLFTLHLCVFICCHSYSFSVSSSLNFPIYLILAFSYDLLLYPNHWPLMQSYNLSIFADLQTTTTLPFIDIQLAMSSPVPWLSFSAIPTRLL